jgi:asparagine synthase (glutamine-hydrolysing)
MWDATRSACIVFNGEIYNFAELREECLRRGREFRGTSDTEVILNLYLLDGAAAWARLDGMFAFCLVDARTGSAFLVRDPMGVKPLYVAERDGELAFASELGALVAAGFGDRGVDPAALQAYLQLDYVPGPMSMLRGVKKLVGGEELRVGADGRTSTRRYASWQSDDEVPRSLDDAVTAFDALMESAVRRQLVADVPVGLFLSGGIDSTIVATMAARVSKEPLHSFSIGFDEPSFDESHWFDLVAKKLGTIHHRKIVTAAEAIELVPRIASVVGEPVADGSIFPTLLLCRFARQHVKVALSGDGADELFGGYPTYGHRASARALSLLPRFARRAMAAAADALMPVSFENLTLGYKARKFLRGLDRDPVVRNHRWLGTFEPEELPGLVSTWNASCQPQLERLLVEASSGVRGRGDLEVLLRDDQRFYLQDQVLVKVDRASMAHALEVRPPFLTEAMVGFAGSLPRRLKVRGATHKLLLREWCARRYPREIADRPKKGFGSPLGHWFRGPLRELVGDVLSREVVARQGLLEPSAVARLVEEHWRGTADRRKEIFNLLMLGLWLDDVASTARSGSLSGKQPTDR